MAAASPSGSSMGADKEKLNILKDELYEHCKANGDETTLYHQDELLDFGVTNNLNTLLQLVNLLINERLLITTKQGNSVLWRWRSVSDAAKYRGLNREQAMVYSMIEDAGADGIWSRTLKARLGMHDSVLKQHIKHLENKHLIKDMKSVEHQNKKMYIKASLRPSEKATGGPWYTDGQLDEAFINDLLKFMFDYIKEKSTYTSRHVGTSSAAAQTKQPKKGILKGDAAAVAASKGKKRGADDMSTEDPAAGPDKPTGKSSRGPKPRKQLLPLPAGYVGYPTAREIAEMISSGNITQGTTLTVTDVQQLVDLLVYDGLVESVRIGKKDGYRIIRPAVVDPIPLTDFMRGGDDDVRELQEAGEMGAPPLSNGFTEAPCGKCPVFELCEEGGPVNPGNCVYFARWLGEDLDINF